jgi:uncharacterized membrane protein YhaH (DUF805 family)
MGFGEAISSVLGKYVGFSGRAPRSEYWYWILFYVIVLVVAIVIDKILGFPIVQAIVSLGLLLPSLAVAIRRLHDLDRSGWWMLLCFVPIANIVLIVWFCMRGTMGPNRFGPDPLP